MKTGYAVLLMFAMCATVLGEDLATIDGTVYRDIRVTEITPIGINFVSNEKACWADFRDLRPDVAQKYGYDPAKAAEFENALAQNQGSTITGDPTEIVEGAAASTSNAIPVGAPVPVQGTNVVIDTPIGNATITFTPPPSPQVIVVNNGDTVIYDQQIDYEPDDNVWVLWNGRYYPRSYWHYWYWKDRYVYWNGRYYPAHCFYNGGVWDHGKYYNYAPSSRRNLPSGNRDSRVSYSARKDDRKINKTQAVVSGNRVTNQVQPVSNDNRGRVQNVVNDNRKPAAQADNQNSVKTQVPAKDNRVVNQVQPSNNDNRGRVQNVANDNRKPAVQADNQNRVKAQNAANDNRKPAAQADNQNSARTQNTAKDNRSSGQAQPGGSDNNRTGGDNRDREDRR